MHMFYKGERKNARPYTKGFTALIFSVIFCEVLKISLMMLMKKRNIFDPDKIYYALNC